MFIVPLSHSAALASRRAPSLASIVDRMFDDSFGRFPGQRSALADSRTPAMDVSESDTHYRVAFDVPGASREALKVSVEGRRVVLSNALPADALPAVKAETGVVGAPVAADAPSADKVLYRERPTVAYARTLVLPAEVDQAASQARYEDGVLTLTLAKKVAAGATQIAIG